MGAGFNRERLQTLLEFNGFAKRFDFICVPIPQTNAGYGVINMITPADARLVIDTLGGSRLPGTQRVITIQFNERSQGIVAVRKHFRRQFSSGLPDANKPAMYRNGARI